MLLLLKNNRLICSPNDAFFIYKKTIIRPRSLRLRCNNDFLRTNMMADYLDKMSTDINYITYVEENEEQSYLQLLIIICILVYMFLDSRKDDQS